MQSLFALTGKEHRRQRKPLVPPFHGRRLAAYERIVEEETVRAMASWPRGRSFATLPSTMRITLDAILRAVFGAEGEEFTRLRTLLPQTVTLGSRLAVLPIPDVGRGRWTEVQRTRPVIDLVGRQVKAERWHSRGIAGVPAKGGRAVVRRREPRVAPAAVAEARA